MYLKQTTASAPARVARQLSLWLVLAVVTASYGCARRSRDDEGASWRRLSGENGANVSCVLEGEAIELNAPQEGQFWARLSREFPTCADPRWRRMVRVAPITPPVPVLIQEFYPVSIAELAPFWAARDQLERVSGGKQCIVAMDARTVEGGFLLSVKTDIFGGCVHRRVQPFGAEFWRIWIINYRT